MSIVLRIYNSRDYFFFGGGPDAVLDLFQITVVIFNSLILIIQEFFNSYGYRYKGWVTCIYFRFLIIITILDRCPPIRFLIINLSLFEFIKVILLAVRNIMENNYLMVNPGIRDKQETWFSVFFLDMIGKGTRSKATSNGRGSSVASILKDSTLSIRTSTDDTNISWVFNGNNDASSNQKLLISLFQVYKMDT